MIEPVNHTLEVRGAVLAYDVRRNASSTDPTLLLIGSPMAAAGFATLSQHFTDRTVVTYDPRGSERSTRTDGATRNTVEEHADDLHRLITAIEAGPVDLFASSGGAVNALALVAEHPGQVRTLVAHEPPLMQVLPDRERALAAARDIHETYMRSGVGAAMAKFIALTSHKGEIPADWLNRPAPDPAQFGLPTEDDGSRNDPLLGMAMGSTPVFEPDFDALRAAPTRIVMAAGSESAGEMANRGAFAVAERLGTTLSSSRATTADSSAASTDGRASPRRSPPSCARCSPRADDHRHVQITRAISARRCSMIRAKEISIQPTHEAADRMYGAIVQAVKPAV